MRTIEFRLRKKSSGKVVAYFSPNKDGLGYTILPSGNDEKSGFGTDEIIWEQFTGLLDKNGTKIFLNDILETFDGKLLVKWSDLNEQDEIICGFVLKLIDGELNYKDLKKCYFQDRHEVIGNIYENKEY